MIEEVELEDSLKVEFMNWALSKAEHYRRIKSFRDKEFNFGGWIRKNIFRDQLSKDKHLYINTLLIVFNGVIGYVTRLYDWYNWSSRPK